MQNVIEAFASQAPIAGVGEALIAEFFAKADICLNGDRPWDVRLHDPRLFMRILSLGTLGAGDAYVDGWWDCDDLSELAFRVFRSGVVDRLAVNLAGALIALQTRLFNAQTMRRSVVVAREHYDLGNDLYFSFLDPYRQYSCGYFRDTEDLDVAQRQKMELICQKLHLSPGQRVLDIGCGWGGLAKYIAERYRCEVVGTTISEEQYQYARESCRDLPVKILKQDYRRVGGEFDKVVSVGMFEHVGYKNYRKYMEVVHRCLKDGGLFLLHSIGGNRSETCNDPWIEKHIFPNSMLPSVQQIGAAIEGLFVMEDWHNFGLDYAKTLSCWHNNFEKNWPTLASSYDERFHRMWHYYLKTLVGAFRARRVNLWQVVLAKGGVVQRHDFRRDLAGTLH